MQFRISRVLSQGDLGELLDVVVHLGRSVFCSLIEVGMDSTLSLYAVSVGRLLSQISLVLHDLMAHVVLRVHNLILLRQSSVPCIFSTSTV